MNEDTHHEPSPCPFCGARAEIHASHRCEGMWVVRCENDCCRTMPMRSKRKLIERWNSRRGMKEGK